MEENVSLKRVFWFYAGILSVIGITLHLLPAA